MILVDTFEPSDIFRLIKQVLPDSERKGLNNLGLADYMFIDLSGRRIQFERKQWAEVLSDMNHVEDQLRREYNTADELNLIIEGVVQPTAYGLDFYKPTRQGKMMRVSRSYGDQKKPRKYIYQQVASWCWQLDKAGITIYWSPNSEGTATILTSAYKNSMKPEHTTLQRYIKQRIQLKDLNPHVKTLMGIEGAQLGPERAQALIDRFETPFEVFVASMDEIASVEGMGHATAKKLVNAMGRSI